MIYKSNEAELEGIKTRLEGKGYKFTWLPNPSDVPGIHGEINDLNFGFFFDPGDFGLFLINLPEDPGKMEIPWLPILEEFEKIVGSKPGFQYQDRRINPTALYWEWNISGKQEDRLAFLAKTSGINKLQKYPPT